ncbi:glycosyltransferase family 2 protein [Marinilabiliaceae bacterium JC017]|nr:glycosyltransferase family 2 protein [Marinilabiliaceae bacterium JC017]
MNKVAVVILNWNGRHLLEKFLPDVINNSSLPNVEVIVADNASSDDSIDFIQQSFPSVKIIRLDKNYGFAGGYNKALKQVEADYFLLLNSDVAPLPNWLPPLIEAMDANPNVAACMPKIKSFTKPDHFEYAGAAGGFIDKFGYPFCRGRLFNKVEKDDGQYDHSIPVFWASGAALMVRSNLYLNSGGLDEDFFAHMEEIDLCWRFKNQGYQILAVTQAEVLHLGGGTLNQQDARKTFLNFRNNLYMLVKNLPAKKLFPILFQRMILDGIAGLHFITKGEMKFFWAVLKAHGSFYKHFARFMKKRKALHPGSFVTPLPEMYHGNIITAFFFKRKHCYNQL